MENGQTGPVSDGFPRPGAEVTLERTGTDAILFDRARRQVHAVNESAALLFELCDGESSEETVTRSFAAAYGVPVTDVEEDVQTILRTFRQLGVIV